MVCVALLCWRNGTSFFVDFTLKGPKGRVHHSPSCPNNSRDSRTESPWRVLILKGQKEIKSAILSEHVRTADFGAIRIYYIDIYRRSIIWPFIWPTFQLLYYFYQFLSLLLSLEPVSHRLQRTSLIEAWFEVHYSIFLHQPIQILCTLRLEFCLPMFASPFKSMQSLVHIVYGSRGATTESTQIKHILWSSLRLQQERSWSPWGIQGAQPITLWAKERQRKLKVSWKIWDKSKFRPANAFWDWAGTQAKRSQSSGWIYDIIDSNVSMHENSFKPFPRHIISMSCIQCNGKCTCCVLYTFHDERMLTPAVFHPPCNIPTKHLGP